MSETKQTSDRAIAANLAAVKETIATAARAAGREPASVTLVAVSKQHPPDSIRAALAAGHRVFGENRVQEAGRKWPALRQSHGDVALHLIGPLQTNKVREAVRLFDVIETIDRDKLAAAIAREIDKTGRRVDCFVQVNTGEEAQKSGCAPADADALIAACVRDHGLGVKGLMCLPPLGEEPALHFALLAKIAERNGLECLSMGMSVDYEIAIQFGATHIRLGTAIFGPRPSLNL